MKMFFRALLSALVICTLVVLIYVLVSFPPIMRGMAAKTMCSCVFVMSRSPESVRARELQVFPGMSDIDLAINYHDSTVTATLLAGQSKAIFRKGLGCTLLSDASESEIKAQAHNTFDFQYPLQDTIPWPTGNLHPLSQHVDRKRVDRLLRDAFDERDPGRPVHTYAVVAVHKGKIIGEQYAEGFGPQSVFTGWSMTKSITNALIGILVNEGRLQPDAPAPIAEWQNDERNQITLNHLLQASSGLRWSEQYFVPGSDFHRMFIHSDDKAGYALNKKLEHTPGTEFEYSSGTTNILSRIIRQTVGDDRYYQFPYESLFSRIGMFHAMMEPDASGTFVASSYGHASARDWARLGMLYLQDGVWEGERILPEGWVRYTTTPAPAAPRGEYGAHVWLNAGAKENPGDVKFPGLPRDAIVFSGFEENSVVIIPSHDLVVVRLGVTHHDNYNLAGLVNGMIDLLPGRDDLALK